MEEIFDTVEELTGHSPTSDTLRNAVHAIITKGVMQNLDYDRLDNINKAQVWRRVGALMILRNVERVARSFEANRDHYDDEDRESCGIFGCLPPDPTNPAINLCRCPNFNFDVDIWKD